MTVIEVLVFVLGAYAAIGVPIGVAFAARGVTRVDAAAVGSGVRFRVLILPGSIGLWPVVLGKWLRASDANRKVSAP